MTRDSGDQSIARNRTLQTEWYGEPLGDRIQRLIKKLGISQAALAEVLGLSAPMLSQLMTARRAKISNPAVLARLMEAEQAAIRFEGLTPGQRSEELDRIRAMTPRASSSSLPREPGGGRGSAPAEGRGSAPAEGREFERPAPAADPVVAIQNLLRSVASADEIETAAALLEDTLPELAAVLRIYGKGRTSDARAHYAHNIVP